MEYLFILASRLMHLQFKFGMPFLSHNVKCKYLQITSIKVCHHFLNIIGYHSFSEKLKKNKKNLNPIL